MNQLDFKNALKEACKNRFNDSEIFEFWKWFDENLKKIDSPSAKDEKFNLWLNELLLEKPVQYIFGYAYFHKYIFRVNENTLIPRPETEELCELILNENQHRKELKGIDIGTGSGCIPITLLKEQPSWKFDALDISKGALDIALLNSQLNRVENQITFIEKDFLTYANEVNIYDIIVSNPPYISKVEMDKMDIRVIQYEPHAALFVNDHILEFYEALFYFFEGNSNPNAQLWMETHQDHCEAVYQIFSKKFNAKKIEDFSQNPRFVYVTK